MGQAMTFLELLQRLHRETDTQGTAPTNVTGLSGMNNKLVGWISSAYDDIQRLHETWLFRQSEFSFPTVATTQNYDQTDASVTNLSQWKYSQSPCDLSGITCYSSVSDEQNLLYLPWADFRAVYKFGSYRTQAGRPLYFTVKPDNSIDLWPIPDAIYTISGEYIITIDTMAISADTPIIPADFHMAIVWRALMFYGASEGAGEVYAQGQSEYSRILAQLEINQLPKMTFGPPLI